MLVIRALCVLLSLSLFSCEDQGGIENRLTSELSTRLENTLSSRYPGISSSGFGVALDFDNDEKIKELSFYFSLKKKVTLNEGRKLIVEATLTALKEINSNPELPPYLTIIPFGPRNIKIIFFFSDENTKPHCTPYLSSADFLKGTLYLCTTDSFGKSTEHKESFEQALQLVQPTLQGDTNLNP